MPRTPFDKLPASGVECGICISNFPSTVKASAITPLGLFAFDSCITNTAGQNATGTGVDAVKSQIATSTTTDQVQANSGAIANNFDKDAVQSEIDLQIKVTQQFDTTRQQAKTIVNQQIDGLNKQVDKAKEALKQNPLDEKAAQQLVDANNAISQWETGGMLIDVVAGGLSGPSNTGLVGSLANAASPVIAQQIGQYFKDNKGLNELDGGNRSEEGSTAHIIAHTILAAATAYAGGNDALLAGLSAGGAEAAMPMVANWLYGETDTSKLNAEQKQTISNIVGLGAAGFTASAGGTITDIAQSALSSQSAVENNILNAVDVSRYLQIALDSHANKGTDMRDRIQALVDKSAENDAMLKVIQKKLDNYRVNGVNTLTPEDYAYLERVEKNFGGKKGMEQTYYAVVQAAKIAVSQGKLTSDDYKNLVNQMYQFNMANPMIGQIDDILTEATVAQKNPSGFTPKVEQPLVVQTKGYDLNSATKQAGIKENNQPAVLTFGVSHSQIFGETGITDSAGVFLQLPGVDENTKRYCQLNLASG